MQKLWFCDFIKLKYQIYALQMNFYFCQNKRKHCARILFKTIPFQTFQIYYSIINPFIYICIYMHFLNLFLENCGANISYGLSFSIFKLNVNQRERKLNDNQPGNTFDFSPCWVTNSLVRSFYLNNVVVSQVPKSRSGNLTT